MVLNNIHKIKSLSAVIIVTFVALWAFGVGLFGESHVEAAPSSYLNFQARIKSSTGGLIADGNYNLEFKMYSASAGGSAIWTETRTSGNRVRVANGYMTVSLGSVNALPGAIDWGEEYWITMNIGGTGVSPSWDGEMSPRLQLTAVPSAFHAQTASGLTDGASSFTASDFIKAAPGSMQAVNSANTIININQTGAGGVLQLQSGGVSVMSIANNGSMVVRSVSNSTSSFSLQDAAGTSLFSMDTTNSRIRVGNTSADSTGTTLVLDTKNTSGDPSGLNGAMYYNSNTGKFRCYEAGVWKDCIASGATGAVMVGGNTQGVAMTLGTNDAYALNFETSGLTQASISSTGATLFKNSTDSTSAFAVQNAAGSYLMNINTTDRKVSIEGNIMPALALDWGDTATMDGSGWASIAYGMGKFVAVASTGTNRVMYSTDGSSWTTVVGSTSHIWTSVAYGDGVFVAVGTGGVTTGRIMRSTDGGVTWSLVSTVSNISNGQWINITYGNGRFVAVSTSGTASGMTSTDGGVTWSAGNTGLSGYAWYDVAYGNGKFIAVSPSTGNGRYAISTDGLTWSNTAITGVSTGGWQSIAYGSGMFIMMSLNGSNSTTSNVLTSTDDGVSWTARSTSEATSDWGDWLSVTYGNGVFVAVSSAGDNRSMSSSDGITWIVGSVTANTWKDVTYGNGIFVAIANNGTNRVMVATEAMFNNVALEVAGNVRFNGNVLVGSIDEKADLLTLDNYYSVTDPRGVNGAMYYNTYLGLFRCYQDGSWKNCIGAGVASVSRVVAPSGASSDVKAMAHYVAAGAQSDEDAINAAIASLPATGGEVKLLGGDFIIDGAINVASNVTISGTGKATRVALKPSTASAVNMFHVSSKVNVVIKDLRIDGQRTSQSTSNHNGIYVTNSGAGFGSSATQGISINNIMAVNMSANGIYFNESNNSFVQNNVFTNNRTSMAFTYQSSLNRVENNSINGGTEYGIFMSGGSAGNSMHNNTMYGASGMIGIYIAGGGANVVSDNFIYSFTTQAIQLYGTASNEIKGNVISTTSNVVKAIYITENTDNTTISNNTVQVGRIDISGGVDTQSNNSIMNNAFSSVSGVAINIGTNAADTYVSGNNLNSTGTISDFGTNTVYGGQQDSGANGNYIIDPSGTGVLEARGVIQLNMGTANTNTAVCYNSSNQLAGCTSASRYKDDVEALSLGLTELNLLQPVSYTWNTTGKQDVGFIAEQVAAVIPQAVEYNLDGEVSTFNYHTISALLVASTQELSVKVDGIDGRLASVENRLTVLEQSVANNPINLTVTQNLTVGANIVVGGKVITSGDAPTVTVHANAGDGADATVQGNDTSGVVTINSGTVNILTGEQVSIVFHDSYTAVPKITITPSTEFSAKVRYYVEQDQNGFRILFLDMPEVSKQYSFNYWIAQ